MTFTDRLKLISEECFTQLEEHQIVREGDYVVLVDGQGCIKVGPDDYMHLAGNSVCNIDYNKKVSRVLRPKDSYECDRLMSDFSKWFDDERQKEFANYEKKIYNSLGLPPSFIKK